MARGQGGDVVEKQSSSRKSSGSFRGRKRIVLKKRPGAARNPAPCVYDPTGATSLKTRYAQQFHRSAAAPFSLHCGTLFARRLNARHYVV